MAYEGWLGGTVLPVVECGSVLLLLLLLQQPQALLVSDGLLLGQLLLAELHQLLLRITSASRGRGGGGGGGSLEAVLGLDHLEVGVGRRCTRGVACGGCGHVAGSGVVIPVVSCTLSLAHCLHGCISLSFSVVKRGDHTSAEASDLRPLACYDALEVQIRERQG